MNECTAKSAKIDLVITNTTIPFTQCKDQWTFIFIFKTIMCLLSLPLLLFLCTGWTISFQMLPIDALSSSMIPGVPYYYNANLFSNLYNTLPWLEQQQDKYDVVAVESNILLMDKYSPSQRNRKTVSYIIGKMRQKSKEVVRNWSHLKTKIASSVKVLRHVTSKPFTSLKSFLFRRGRRPTSRLGNTIAMYNDHLEMDVLELGLHGHQLNRIDKVLSAVKQVLFVCLCMLACMVMSGCFWHVHVLSHLQMRSVELVCE